MVGRITSAVGRSVGHIGRASGGVPAPAGITAHQPPVDPAGHDSVGMAAAVRRRVAPTSLLRTLGSTSAYPNGLYRHSSGASSLQFPPVAGLLLLVCRRRLILPPTRQITSRQTQQSAQGWCRWVTGAVKGVLISGQSPAVAAKLRGKVAGSLLGPVTGLSRFLRLLNPD